MHTRELVGIVLWRSGLALAAASGFYYGAWQFVSQLAWPRSIQIGVTVTFVGCAMLLLSLILERRQDAKAEGDLTQ